MDNQSIVAEKSFSFAVRIVKLYQYICNNKKEYVLFKQLLRSGTSIGANIQEALNGQSKRDFLSKMNIALKEAGETQYWLRLLTATEILTEKESRSILDDCTELLKMLTSIVKTTSSNLQ
ncbi:four helix bundle protein [Christensenella intestinihominis]|uniref:four helix bundle protein n=1 Tax=Christensenella intestinihominis TaxID=1851429 RepID=UPI00082D4F7E|nr:four helix bundle protein [Christensenella intestinihominis]